MKRIIFIIYLHLISQSIFAGTAQNPLLNINTDPISISSSGSASYNYNNFFNPGSASFIVGKRFFFSQSLLFNTMPVEQLSLMFSNQRFFKFGLELKTLISPGIDMYTDVGDFNRVFRYVSYSAKFLFAFNIIHRIGFGFNLIYSGEILPYNSSSDSISIYTKHHFGADLGLTVRIFKELYFGVAVNNIRFITIPFIYIRYKNEYIPLSVKGGLSYTYDIIGKSFFKILAFSSDYIFYFPDLHRGFIGFEAVSRKIVKKLKIVIRTGFSFPESIIISGLRIGAGIKLQNLSIDFSYRTYLTAGNDFYLSISYFFNQYEKKVDIDIQQELINIDNMIKMRLFNKGFNTVAYLIRFYQDHPLINFYYAYTYYLTHAISGFIVKSYLKKAMTSVSIPVKKELLSNLNIRNFQLIKNAIIDAMNSKGPLKSEQNTDVSEEYEKQNK